MRLALIGTSQLAVIPGDDAIGLQSKLDAFGRLPAHRFLETLDLGSRQPLLSCGHAHQSLEHLICLRSQLRLPVVARGVRSNIPTFWGISLTMEGEECWDVRPDPSYGTQA